LGPPAFFIPNTQLMSILDGFFSLSSGTNKTKQANTLETTEGAISTLVPELTLDITDEELIALKTKWIQDWEPYAKDIAKLQEDNEDYWQGKQFPGAMYNGKDRPLQDNVIFEALETALPNFTRQNPEPMVECEDETLAKKVQQKLADLADVLRLKLQLKRVARYWALYHLGVSKVAFDPDTNDVSLVTLRPQKLILEPDATIDENMEYTGSYIGEYRDMAAWKLIKLYPKSKQVITEKVKGKMGTKVRYIEWWTDEYVFWTLDNEVLGKNKNPHWNYEGVGEQVDEYGQTTPNQPLNHFPVPKKPYVFLSIFNLGKHPHDDTSLIQQNLSQQDLVNKRHRQIDKNADGLNGGWAISGEKTGLTKEEAAEAINATRLGGGIYIASGSVQEGVQKLIGEALPTEVFNQQLDVRTRILDSFGVRGSTARGIVDEKTVRGKIIVKGQDGDRASFITEFLEQYSDQIFNWFIQFLYVYKPTDYPFGPPLIASVKEGSLIPKDSVTKANQAVELATAGLMSLLDLYTRLDDPDPQTTAANAWLEKNAPEILYANDPRVQQAIQAQQQAQQMQLEQQQADKAQQHEQNMQGKQVDNEAKMQQIQAKNEGSLLNRVPISP